METMVMAVKKAKNKKFSDSKEKNENIQWHQKKTYENKNKRKKPKSSLWIYGKHPVEAALVNHKRQCSRLLIAKESEKESRELRKMVKMTPDLYVETLSRSEISTFLPPGAVHQGFALNTTPLPPVYIEDICKMSDDMNSATVVILDQVTDPHNVGAIIRTAAAFNALAVIVADRHAPEESGLIAKASSGAIEKTPFVRVVNLARALQDLKDAGFWTIGLDVNGEKTIDDTELPEKKAIIFGSEGKGLRRLTQENCDFLVRLPISNKVESLNVSNAAAITLYEVSKRK